MHIKPAPLLHIRAYVCVCPASLSRLRGPDQCHSAGVCAGLQARPAAAAPVHWWGNIHCLGMTCNEMFWSQMTNNDCLSQIPRLCAEEVAAQEQTGQVEECLKINLLKISHEGCKKVRSHWPWFATSCMVQYLTTLLTGCSRCRRFSTYWRRARRTSLWIQFCTQHAPWTLSTSVLRSHLAEEDVSNSGNDFMPFW